MIIQNNKIDNAINTLKNGNVIIYETDTLYGLGADATNNLAVEKINNLKKRKTPLSIMLDSIEAIEKYANINTFVRNKLIEIFPGPFTVLLEKRKTDLCDLVTNNSNKIGIRIPKNKFCIELLKKYKKPIITTSVNIHGYKALNNIDEIEDIFFNINIYKGEVKESSKGSTILDFTANPPNIIREGDGIYNK